MKKKLEFNLNYFPDLISQWWFPVLGLSLRRESTLVTTARPASATAARYVSPKHIVRIPMSSIICGFLDFCWSRLLTPLPQLRAHMVCVHSIKSYQCRQCRKSFLDKEDYIKHLDLHPQRKFQCDKCPSSFDKQHQVSQKIHNYFCCKN